LGVGAAGAELAVIVLAPTECRTTRGERAGMTASRADLSKPLRRADTHRHRAVGGGTIPQATVRVLTPAESLAIGGDAAGMRAPRRDGDEPTGRAGADGCRPRSAASIAE